MDQNQTQRNSFVPINFLHLLLFVCPQSPPSFKQFELINHLRATSELIFRTNNVKVIDNLITIQWH